MHLLQKLKLFWSLLCWTLVFFFRSMKWCCSLHLSWVTRSSRTASMQSFTICEGTCSIEVGLIRDSLPSPMAFSSLLRWPYCRSNMWALALFLAQKRLFLFQRCRLDQNYPWARCGPRAANWIGLGCLHVTLKYIVTMVWLCRFFKIIIRGGLVCRMVHLAVLLSRLKSLAVPDILLKLLELQIYLSLWLLGLSLQLYPNWADYYPFSNH